jgi:putative spermidine/putrescine transport system substrate-binding protein/spermidine/putrescine transport system substrate-binding protein
MTNLKRRLITVAAAAALTASASVIAVADDNELTIFEWSGYEAPEFHPRYVEKYGTSPTFTFFGDEDEAFEKLRSGFKADLAHPCSQGMVKWREAGCFSRWTRRRSPGGTTCFPASWR